MFYSKIIIQLCDSSIKYPQVRLKKVSKSLKMTFNIRITNFLWEFLILYNALKPVRFHTSLNIKKKIATIYKQIIMDY
jgi:hypothetical protein